MFFNKTLKEVKMSTLFHIASLIPALLALYFMFKGIKQFSVNPTEAYKNELLAVMGWAFAYLLVSVSRVI